MSLVLLFFSFLFALFWSLVIVRELRGGVLLVHWWDLQTTWLVVAQGQQKKIGPLGGCVGELSAFATSKLCE